jgi:hypothetical protein
LIEIYKDFTETMESLSVPPFSQIFLTTIYVYSWQLSYELIFIEVKSGYISIISEEHKLTVSCAWSLILAVCELINSSFKLWGRSAAQGKAQAQDCELEAQLISSSREDFNHNIDFLLNSTIIFNLEFDY